MDQLKSCRLYSDLFAQLYKGVYNTRKCYPDDLDVMLHSVLMEPKVRTVIHLQIKMIRGKRFRQSNQDEALRKNAHAIYRYCLSGNNLKFSVEIFGYYTPGIYADGYIVFAFPFVRSYVSSFVSSFVIPERS